MSSYPPIDEFPAEYDPAHANWQPLPGYPTLSAVNLQPNYPTPAAPAQFSFPAQPIANLNTISTADLYKYMFPMDPTNNDRTVIGVYTRGTSTTSKKELEGIYQAAGIPFTCHSCNGPIKLVTPVSPPRFAPDGTPIPAPAITPFYAVIGDHQPPTALFNLITNYARLAQGIFGKIGHTACMVMHSNNLPLYNFTYQGTQFQTNNYQLAVNLSRQQPTAVTYGTGSEQYLYPHCEGCSYTQGQLLR